MKTAPVVLGGLVGTQVGVVYLSRRLSSTGAHTQRPGINTTTTVFH